jgi:hypothetical protein
MSGTDNRPPNPLMQYLYDNSQTIASVIPDDETKYNTKEYPYASMKQNPRSTEIDIRSNY